MLVPFADQFTRIRDPEFSPDGQSIVFRGGLGTPSHLYLVTNLYGPEAPVVRQLTDTEYQDSWPHFSPDGSKLVFTRANVAGRNYVFGNVWTLDLKTGQETRLVHTVSPNEACALGWCPFDNQIYYGGSLAGGTGAVFRLSQDGKTETLPTGIIPNGRLTWTYAAPGWTRGPCPASR